MLVEIPKVRQIEDEGFRRWFTDDYFDLIVWYSEPKDPKGEIVGFQLCYDKFRKERALTWRKGDEYIHSQIDSGELPYSSKMTPVLLADGIFDKKSIADRFRECSENIDPEITRIVLEKIACYSGV